MAFLLKGYRLDTDKIAKKFNVDPPDRAFEYKFWIIKTIDRNAYKYIGTGFEQSGHTNLMIVMDDGYKAEMLMNTPIPDAYDANLRDIARSVCTPGVWPDYDYVYNPETFWHIWEQSGGYPFGELPQEEPKQESKEESNEESKNQLMEVN